MRVKCNNWTRPARWREELKTTNKAAHTLIKWVERDDSDGDWLTIQCLGGQEEKLMKLLRDNHKVQYRRGPNGVNNGGGQVPRRN